MSEMERNKGTLFPVPWDLDMVTEDELDALLCSGNYAVVNRIPYRVKWEVEGETDFPVFAEVNRNADGSINFHTYHHNGSAHWSELVEERLKGGGG